MCKIGRFVIQNTFFVFRAIFPGACILFRQAGEQPFFSKPTCEMAGYLPITLLHFSVFKICN